MGVNSVCCNKVLGLVKDKIVVVAEEEEGEGGVVEGGGGWLDTTVNPTQFVAGLDNQIYDGRSYLHLLIISTQHLHFTFFTGRVEWRMLLVNPGTHYLETFTHESPGARLLEWCRYNMVLQESWSQWISDHGAEQTWHSALSEIWDTLYCDIVIMKLCLHKTLKKSYW